MGKLLPAVRKKIQKSEEIPLELQAEYPRLHFCPDWDFMLINDDDDEFDCCGCYYQDGLSWKVNGNEE